MKRDDALTQAIVVLAFAMTPSCGRPVAETECSELIERYTELLVKEEEPTATADRVARLQMEAHTLARRSPRLGLATCSEQVSRHSYECAMKAPTVDEIERCLVF